MTEIEILEQEILIAEKELEIEKKKVELLKLKDNTKKEEIAPPLQIDTGMNNNTILYYTPKTRQRGAMQVKKLKRDGRFVLGNGITSKKYDIHTVINLKKELPSLYTLQSSGKNIWSYLARKLDISVFLAAQLCYAIEIGVFDEYITQWQTRLKWER